MAINVRTKGQEGEREIARDLNGIVNGILRELELPPYPDDKPRIQRNQNQTAVGGCDLTDTFELAIEIKRQEQLSINPWWAQCVASARALDQKPVLIFRQNTPGGGRKLWRVILEVELGIPGAPSHNARAEISYDDFKLWFGKWAREHLLSEHNVKPRPIAQLQTTGNVDELPELAPVRLRLPDLYAEL